MEEDLISYPRGWEWLKTVPTEDFNWLIEILFTMTDDTDTYSFIEYDTESNHKPYKVKYVQRRDLADFMDDYFGMEDGIITHSHYILCKALEVKSKEDYMLALPKIREILRAHKEPSNK